LAKPAAVPVNPNESLLGAENSILSGTATSYYVPDYEGCLSIKTTVLGSAVWEADGRRFAVHENSYLVLNDRQRYTVTIDSAKMVTTFCIFFKRGFVEDVFRATVTPGPILLDNPEPGVESGLEFFQKLETGDTNLLRSVRKFRGTVIGPDARGQEADDGFYIIAAELLKELRNLDTAGSRLPAVRTSTRIELHRRLLRGRDHMLSSLDQPLQLSAIAREACLSPYHFHRSFTKSFGETPQRYLTRHRLEKAAYLLEYSTDSITEICLETGFENPASFSSAFRKQFGTSPRQYRSTRP
jgi:AraC family transcriptional regulator